MDWVAISNQENLSEDFIREHKDKVNWHSISLQKGLSEAFIEEHMELLDWRLVSMSQTLSESFIIKHKKHVQWETISYYQQLSEPFIIKHFKELDFLNILHRQKLSESFIENYQHRAGFWYALSHNPHITEERLEMFLDKWNWLKISEYVPLSEAFIRKHILLIELRFLKDNKYVHLTEEQIKSLEELQETKRKEEKHELV